MPTAPDLAERFSERTTILESGQPRTRNRWKEATVHIADMTIAGCPPSAGCPGHRFLPLRSPAVGQQPHRHLAGHQR
uniref:Uncharacterized protein n=1 Tax=Tanacetum cinerariifolium TaxID=118510 RepID=A0A699UPS3_TANCI|nr:hypothetical protein [Tanacetum cinerariifolium]